MGMSVLVGVGLWIMVGVELAHLRGVGVGVDLPLLVAVGLTHLREVGVAVARIGRRASLAPLL